MSELLPCPLCGSEAEEGYFYSIDHDAGWGYPQCSNKACGISMMYENTYKDGFEQAVARWNALPRPKAQSVTDEG